MNWSELQHINKQQLLTEVSKRTDFYDFIIEKDWWVVQTLRLISQMDIAEHIVFKGGTSLSKAWGIINRFSEDVDLAINHEFFGFAGDISRSQVRKMKFISNEYISNNFLSDLQKTFNETGTNGVQLSVVDKRDSDDDPVKIAVEYPAVAEYAPYVKPRVLLEIGSRSMMEPSSLCTFRSIMGAHFSEQPFADENVSFLCINPERTFLEKLFLLHEERQRPVERMKIEGKSRHFYDICQIAKTNFAEIAIADKELYKTIVVHRERFTKISGIDYTSHFPPNLNPIPSAEILPKWEQDYEEVRGNMIVGDSPDFEELINEIKHLCKRINEENTTLPNKSINQ